MTIDDNDRGRADVGGNELMVDSKIDDPPKVRQGSPVVGGSFGCLSGDRVIVDERGVVISRKEKTLLILKPDDSGREGGCYDFHAALPGREDDAGMVRVARLTTQAFELFVPLVQHAGGPVPVPSPKPPVPPAPPAPTDPTHGIPPGAFFEVLRIYGFASDDEQPYYAGSMTWAVVIERMDRRDDYRKFPR